MRSVISGTESQQLKFGNNEDKKTESLQGETTVQQHKAPFGLKMAGH